MEKIIEFAPSGAVFSLHQDGFNLGFLGPQKIERATDIQFNETRQNWDIYVLPQGETGGGFHWTIPSLRAFTAYDEARRFEVAWINLCMIYSADWRAGDERSRDIADDLRANWSNQ